MKIIHNVCIHTLDQNNPIASAIAIDNGRIVAIGGNELLMEFERADREDMEKKIILPGLTDAHIHLQ
jgi:predicted amidohydrolase YtcJ